MPNTREKLIELVEQGYKEFFNPNWGGDFFAVIADHLIANGVKIPVLCKECKYCDQENGHCDHPMGTTLPVPRKQNDFCSYGERKDH